MIEPGPSRFYLAPWLIVAVVCAVLWFGLIVAAWQLWDLLSQIIAYS